MAYIAYRRFAGMQPRLSARLLPDVNAQNAVNTQFDNGKLRAFRRSRQEFAVVNAGPILSIFKYRGGGKEGWLSWDTDVDVIRAPLAGDDYGRIYLTGDGPPKFGDSESVIQPEGNGVGSVASGAVVLTINTNRGFATADPVRITYSPGVFQDVTCTNFVAAGVNGTLSITPATTGTVNAGTTITNRSQRYPIYLYDLGVPGPSAPLAVSIQSGGTEGTEGVQQGTIVSVSDIVIHNVTVMDESTVGELQSGSDSGWMLGPHAPFHDIAGVVSNGEPMILEASALVGLPINRRGETRDIEYEIRRNPASTNIQVGKDTTHVARPAGSGYTDWEYTVRADAIDVPASGTYTYRLHFGPVAGLEGDGNNSYNVKVYWTFKARYSTRVKLTLEADHGLAVDDTITLTLTATPDTGPDKDLNGKTLRVLAVSGNDITVEGTYGGTYAPGGTWKKAYATDETADRAYVYTYIATINGQDFESPPSAVTPVVTMAIDGTARLSGFINPTSPVLLWNTNYTSIRVYRLNPGESVQAEYLHLTDLPLNTTTYDDSALGETLGKVLRSTSWELPPNNLRGIIELPEGGAAGFTDKEFCMAEPYYLHAWPQANRRTTHDEIVALVAFGTSIAITTKGRPYVVTGLDPATVSMEQVETSLPNLSKRGTIDGGYAALYPSSDGLALIGLGRAENVTADLFTPRDWRALNPATFVACDYNGKYLAFYDSTVPNLEYPALSVSYRFPPKGAIIIDPQHPGDGVVFLDFWASEVWTDPRTKKVFYVDGANIREFDADRMELEYTWVSRRVVLPRPVSMGWARVEAKRYPLKIVVIADSQVLYTRNAVDREPFRLPATTAESFEIELSGQHEVEAVYLAETIRDLLELEDG